jgi:multidrug transporter EmrE-like cation transporter
MTYWLALAACLVANVMSNVAFKRAMDGTPIEASWHGLLALIGQPWLWVGGLCAGVVLSGYLYALKGVPMSIAYPTVTSMATVGVALAGHVLFGEALGARALVGIALVVSGVTLLGLSKLA